MKRFIISVSVMMTLFSVNAYAEEAQEKPACDEKAWEFTYAGEDGYFKDYLMKGWLKYKNNNLNCEATTNTTTEATTQITTETTTRVPVQATTEATTQITTETTTKVPVQTTEETTKLPTQTTTETTTEITTQEQNNSQNKTMEEQVVSLVNKHRNANGLKALKINSSVSKVAQAKSQDMKDNNYFSHTSPVYGDPFNMLKSFGVSYKTAGENIAKGQQTAEAVVNAWMNSEGHRKNILNANFEEIGVGYVKGNGTTYWTQLFIKQ